MKEGKLGSKDRGANDAIRPLRRILGRSLQTQYITLEGLQASTGVNPDKFVVFIVEQLIVNALDALDECLGVLGKRSMIPTIELTVRKIGSFLKIKVRDNGPGLDDETIKKITDFTRLYSSRFHYKYPTRGSMGNAWKCILGMTHTLASALKVDYSESPVVITSHGKMYVIRVDVKRENIYVKVKTRHAPMETGTIVEITLPIYSDRWLDEQRYRRLIEGFAYFNPHVEFLYKNAEGETISFPRVEERRPSKKLRESIYWSSPSEFWQRVEAEIRENLERGLQRHLVDLIQEYLGFGRKDAPYHVLHDVGVENVPLEELADRRELVDKIYWSMRKRCAIPSASVLEPIRRVGLLNRLKEIDGFVHPRYLRYVLRRERQEYQVAGTTVSVPFVVEVMVAVRVGIGRVLYVSINRSPKFEDPFGNYDFWFKDKVVTGIRGILDKNGVKYEEPVIVLVNITCPNVQYKDPGKVRIDVTPFFNAIKESVDKASRFYKRARREIAAAVQGHYIIPKTQKEVTLRVLPKAVQRVSSNGKYRYKQRQLWYVVRGLLDNRGLGSYSPKYNYFPRIIEKSIVDLSDLLKEANAELHEPRSDAVIPLSTEGVENYKIPRWKYNKILYVEKRGFKDVLVANRFHDRYDLAVIGGQGESSMECRKLLKSIEQIASKRKEGITILCVHDADLWGHDISLTLSRPSHRMKRHWLNVVDLGLTMTEAVKMGLKPEKVIHKKAERVPKKLIRCLPDKELQLLTGMEKYELLNAKLKESYRVELNAFTPEQFLSWLDKKLEEHEVRRKVRPPDSVVAEETKETVDESLEKHIKNMIFELCGGGEVVDKLKNSILKQEKLNGLNVSEEMDNRLKTFPTEGWDDIIQEEVNRLLDGIFEKDTVRSEIHKEILSRLRGRNHEELPFFK